MASQVNSTINLEKGFSHSSVGKESACNAETQVRFLGWEDLPGEANDGPLQYSFLENSKDRGA